MADVIRIGYMFNHEKSFHLGIGKKNASPFFFVNQLIFFVKLCFQKNAKVVTIDGYEDVPQNDEKSLKKALANQPISVAIEAGGRDFQLYQSVMIFLLFRFFKE